MSKSSYNLVDYVEDYIYTWEERPFNEVDSLVFSWFTYLHFEASSAMQKAGQENYGEQGQQSEQTAESSGSGPFRMPILRRATNRIVNWKVWDREAFGRVFKKEFEDEGVELKELYRAEEFEALVKDVNDPEEKLRLLAAMACSPRYRSVRLYDYRNELDALEEENGKQFAAVTYQISDALFYVAYRGTDRSFTGWKEDFLMSLDEPVPSQRLALSYLEEMADKLPGSILVGGHSKGGNLAVDASARCRESVQERIRAVYTHDGPGFLGVELEYEGFAKIRDRIHKTIPQSSLIGLAFNQEAEYRIIESNESGIMQHEPISWQVKEDHFIYRDKLTSESLHMYHKVNNWLELLDMEERRRFIDAVFMILEQSGTDNFGDLYANWKTYIPVTIRAIADLDDDLQKFMLDIIRQFIKADGKAPAVKEHKEHKEHHRFRRFLPHAVRGADVSVENETEESDDTEEQTEENPNEKGMIPDEQ